MSGAPTPPFIPEAFAADADPAYINTIPDTTVNPQRASYELGFPPQTMTPINSGGKPMLGPDMNGILNAMTAHLFAQQGGQLYVYSVAASTAMGGYAKGAVVAMADGTGAWQNNVDGNTTDPDDVSAAGWVTFFRYGYTTATSTGGTYTLTAAESSRAVVIITGALIANLQVIFPTLLRSWLIVNNTSGAFTVTAKTAAGSGVVIPPGSFSAPVEVYGNGVSLFPTVAPLTIPTSVAAVADTYVLRSNTADVYGHYLNSNVGVDNAAITNVITDQGDGFFRKNSLANFEAQMLLQMIGGAVTSGQVPQAAVTQYTPQILASATLTGTPTAPTPAAGDNSTKVATTAFVAGSIVPSAGTVNTQGSFTLPGGAIVKVGYSQGGAGIGDVGVAFSAAFPNHCWGVICCSANRNGAGANGTGYARAWSTAGFTMFVDAQQTNGNGGTIGNRGGLWIAVGN